MDEQLTVRIPAELGRALRRASRQLQRKNSEIVRLALQAFLQTNSSADAAPASRAKHLVGSIESGIPDLATRHREYLLERLRHGR